MNDNEAPLHIVELRSENFKRLQAVTVRPEGGLVLIGGKNFQGKSSLLDSIESTLGGAKYIPADPVRHGARRSRTIVDLGELIVERVFDAKGSSVVVRMKDGTKRSSPQTVLDELTKALCFDPLKFARDEPKKQDATLKAVLGLDFTEIEAKRQKAYDSRTDANRDVKGLGARVNALPIHLHVPPEEVSVAELAKKLETMQETKRANDAARAEIIGFDRSIDFVDGKLIETQAKIDRLEKELALEKELLWAFGVDRKNIVQKKADAEAVERIDPDLEPVKLQLTTVEETNRKVRENAERKRLEEELRAAEDKVVELNDEIADLDQEKAEKLAAAEFPIKGLGFDDVFGPMLNGVPLAQASQAERLRLSVAIGAAMNPRVRVMLIREGSSLDDDGLKLLAELGEETGFQLWVERVGKNDAGAIIIEDGMVLVEAAQ